MKGRILSGITPQQKMVAVNNKFGNTNIKNQQGTTRTLFDSLPLDGRLNYRFFENANQRAFPLTNLGADGNLLPVGETFTLQKMYFSVILIDPNTKEVSDFQPIHNINSAFKLGELDFMIANNQVVKQLPTMFTDPNFNFTQSNNLDVSFNFATDIIIPPLLEFIAQVRLIQGGTWPIPNSAFVRCTIQGTAGILAPQTTF